MTAQIILYQKDYVCFCEAEQEDYAKEHPGLLLGSGFAHAVDLD